MLRYGKTAQNAIAAVSYLVSSGASPRAPAGSRVIAEGRHLSKPIVAKLLTALSGAGLVGSAPGPHGGYWLSRSPENISLLDVVILFERSGEQLHCPFGPDWCGVGAPCPLHDRLFEETSRFEQFLRETSFSIFLSKSHELAGR